MYSIVICLFAKPPVPGSVKTRLATTFGHDTAAQLAGAFLRDTWAQVVALDWAHGIVATTEPLAPALGIPAAQVWQQGDGDLGMRIARVMTRGLAEHGAAIAIGADTPGMPDEFLAATHRCFTTGERDAVLGPTDDGGFYLLGLRRFPEDLLVDLPWSRNDTFAATRARLAARGLNPLELPRWFDIDRPADLNRFEALLAAGEIHAPCTAELLANLRRHSAR